MKKLPKIYQNDLKKIINNNKKVCYLDTEVKQQDPQKNIIETLDSIFSGIGYSYNIPVIITTKDNIYNTSIITKTKNNIVTLDNDIIPISEILNLEIDKNK